MSERRMMIFQMFILTALADDSVYWTPVQMDLWKELVIKKECPVVLYKFNDLIENCQINGYMPAELTFFSVAVYAKSNFIAPLTQSITENKKIQIFMIRFFLEFLKHTEPPHQFLVTELCFELLNGISRALNNCIIQEYISCRFQFLLDTESRKYMPTHIFLDINSILEHIDNSEVFKNQNDLIKNFLRYCIIYLSVSIDSIESLEDFIQDTIIVFTRSKFDKSTAAVTETLKKRIRNDRTKAIKEQYELNLLNQKIISGNTFTIQDKFNIIDSQYFIQVREFINKIIEQANKGYVPGTAEKSNSYNRPNIFQFYLDLLHIFPLWINFTHIDNDVCSSMNVRKFIKDHHLPNIKTDIETFLLENIENINITTDNILANMTSSPAENVLREKSKNVNLHHCLNLEENWMGKNENLCLRNKNIEDIFNEGEGNSCAENDESSDDLINDVSTATTFSPVKKVKNSKVPTADEVYDKLVKIQSIKTIVPRQTKKKSPVKRLPKYTQPPQYDLDTWYKQQAVKKRFRPVHLTNGKLKSIEYLKDTPKATSKNLSKFILGDTSPFDSIFEILCFAYNTLKSFQRYVESVECSEELCILKCMQNWCTTGNRTVINKNRGQIILKYGTRNRQNIIISENLGHFYSHIMEEHFLEYINAHCTECKMDFEKSISRIQLTDKKLIIENLEDELFNMIFKSTLSFCNTCHAPTEPQIELPFPILFIDVEECGIKIFINSFPDKLQFSDSIKYIQVGVIGYELQYNDKMYIAYAKSITKRWWKIDSSKKKVIESLKKFPKILVAAVIYIKL